MSLPSSSPYVTLEDITQARDRISAHVHKTPIITSSTLDGLAPPNCHILMKCENLQRVGAFKIRGATNAVQSILSQGVDPSQLTVVTHSSGNHAQALALASRQLGVRCHVVMPSNAPSVKLDAVRGYGADVTQCEPTLVARETTAQAVIEKERSLGRTVEFVPPYNDVRVIAGQGTMALEFLEQAEELGNELDILITPVGGGGMLSGCAVAAKGVSEDIVVLGAEPANADDAQRSLRGKQFHESVSPKTIADGLLTSLGDITFPLIVKHVNDIFTVSEDQIVKALKLCLERLKMVVEPSGAVPLAVVLFSEEFTSLASRLSEAKKRPLNVGIVFSGGNVELSKLLRLFEPSQ